jgi:hypothetical protein
MKFNQINIARKSYNSTLGQLKNENNDIQGGYFSFTPSQKEIYPLSSPKINEIEQNLSFIISHLQDPIFPRNIMTKALGYQKEAFNIKEVLEYFRSSNYEDCRINAYPSFTKYNGINRTAPSFLMIDIDLKDFVSKDKLDRALNRILRRIESCGLYQSVSGFIIEQEEVFAKFIDRNGKDLTTKLMQFAENFLTNKKGDRQHGPSINSCLVSRYIFYLLSRIFIGYIGYIGYIAFHIQKRSRYIK